MDSKPPAYQPLSTTDVEIGKLPPHTIQFQGPDKDENPYEPKPNTYIPLSVFAILCCTGFPAFLCAITAMIYSCQVDMAWELGHRARAKRASVYSRNLGIAAIIIGAISLLAATLLIYFGFKILQQQQQYLNQYMNQNLNQYM